MNLLERIKGLFNLKRIPKLDAPKKEITTDELESLLQGSKKFRGISDRTTRQKYKRAMHIYISYLLLNNIELTKKELKKAQAITGNDYSISNGNDYGVKAFVAEMVRSRSAMNAFSELLKSDEPGTIYRECDLANGIKDIYNLMHDKNKIYSMRREAYFEADDVAKEIVNAAKFFEFYSSRGIVLDEVIYKDIEDIRAEIQNRAEEIVMLNVQERRGLPEDAKVNPDFEELVTRRIGEPVKDKEEMAFKIYNALNQSVEFEPGYFIKEKDQLSQDFITRIYNRPIGDISKSNNKVICKTWAELYVYFLAKYGIEASVVESANELDKKERHGHAYVETYGEDGVIKADATDGILSTFDFSGMSDLARAKLGLPPAGFESKRIKNKLAQEIAKGRLYKDRTTYIFRKDVNILMELMSKDKDFKELPIEEKIGEGLEYMKHQMEGIDLPNMALTEYMKALFFASLAFVTDKHEKGSLIRLSTSLYKQVGEDHFEYIPVIYLRTGEKESPQYRYLVYNGQELTRNIKARDKR